MTWCIEERVTVLKTQSAFLPPLIVTIALNSTVFNKQSALKKKYRLNELSTVRLEAIETEDIIFIFYTASVTEVKSEHGLHVVSLLNVDMGMIISRSPRSHFGTSPFPNSKVLVHHISVRSRPFKRIEFKKN